MTEERNQRPISSWGDLFMRTVELGLGAATLTLDTAQRVVSDLIGRGQVSREEAPGLVDRLMALGREQREQLSEMIDRGVERAMIRMDLARRSDLEALHQRVADLEKAVMGYTTTSETPIPPIHEAEITDNE